MMIPRQSGPEPKACSMEWDRLLIVDFGMLAYLWNVIKLREQREGKGMISKWI